MVLAFRGTQPDDQGLLADAFILSGEEQRSDYHRKGLQTLQAVIRWADRELGTYQMRVCGHSLGGSLALWTTQQQRLVDQAAGLNYVSFRNHAGTFAYSPGSSAARGSDRLIDTYGTNNPLNHYYFVENDPLSFSLMAAFRTEQQLQRVVVKPGRVEDIATGINHDMNQFIESQAYIELWKGRKTTNMQDHAREAVLTAHERWQELRDVTRAGLAHASALRETARNARPRDLMLEVTRRLAAMDWTPPVGVQTEVVGANPLGILGRMRALTEHIRPTPSPPSSETSDQVVVESASADNENHSS